MNILNVIRRLGVWGGSASSRLLALGAALGLVQQLHAGDNTEVGTSTSSTQIKELHDGRALNLSDAHTTQRLRVVLQNSGADQDGRVLVDGIPPVAVRLQPGQQTVDLDYPAVGKAKEIKVAIEVGGRTVASKPITLKPVRNLVVYILPHSHTDIGYTEIQTAVEAKQMRNLEQGIDYAEKTQNYPSGAQFKWNVEVLWAADLYEHRMSASQRDRFKEAVRKGWVSLNGMYLNELTGLCRPEELTKLFRYATVLGEECGVKVDSAMISDVPGYTWGTVTAMAQAGIKYFSTAPNYFDRIGDILQQWENKPFYWMSPSGKEKVLVWIPYKGYAMSHIYKRMSPELVEDIQNQLDHSDYPYDIAYVRWSGHGDNAVPDPEICEFVKDWNSKFAYPRFIIAGTSEAFSAFEARYASKLPKVSGDWTPYWEDGAGSSAAETAMNRASSDRLSQAESLWAMLDPRHFPATAFREAWRNTLLYSEHTWGADCSVSDPENTKTKEQWAIKRSYAFAADAESHKLLQDALASVPSSEGNGAVRIYNPSSWPRTELVELPSLRSGRGDRVSDELGRMAPSQRLSNGDLVFVARDVSAFGSKMYFIGAGEPINPRVPATARGVELENGFIHIALDPKNGGIVDFHAKGLGGNLVDTSSGGSLNQYLFLEGDDVKKMQSNGEVKISVRERGPLVASLLVESEAPGCNKLTREIQIVAGFDYVQLINTVDKKRAPISPKPGDWSFAQKGGKESVNFGFPFQVENGEMRLDVPLGVIRPELDQIPSACKNWFTVGRWVDISNDKAGVSWITLDAPLVEVGGITATLVGSQSNPAVWRKHVEPTQKFYSWAMNNHWGTNYRAYQEGPVVFRYLLHPHGSLDIAEASRFATGFSQPLWVGGGTSDAKIGAPLLRISPSGVLVVGFKPSDDGNAWILQLFGASGKTLNSKLMWGKPAPRRVCLTDTSERPGKQLSNTVEVPAYGVVTIRAELP